MVRRVIVMMICIASVAAGCSFNNGGQVQRIGANDVPYRLDDTIATTTSSTTTTTILAATSTSAAPTSSTIAFEAVRLYFITGGQLTYVLVPVPSPVALPQVMAKLQEGPPQGDIGTGLRTALPGSDVQIPVSDDGSGIASVDLPAGFFDTIPQTDQRFAIAQLVLTLRLAGIGQVRFTQLGEPVRVPRGTGELAEPGQPLALQDYEVLLKATPPTTSTSLAVGALTVDPNATTTSTVG